MQLEWTFINITGYRGISNAVPATKIAARFKIVRNDLQITLFTPQKELTLI